MIAYIKGTLDEVTSKSIIVESGGVGYEILTYDYVIRKLPALHSDIKIFTYLDVKEDSMKLYGFLSNREKELFIKLISVSGVGPKGALSILNELGPDNLLAAIIANDSKAISKANGIGAKTAQKVVIELKDSVSLEGSIFDQGADYSSESDDAGVVSDAAQALCALGYSNTDALKAIRKIKDVDGKTAQQLIKEALKYL